MSGRGKKGRGTRGRGIQYVQNEEPSFIRQFKENIGYKEGPDVDTKRQQLDIDDDDQDDDHDGHDDEKPVVVVLKDGDLTAEEVEAVTERLEENQKGQSAKAEAGKILFTKPTKRCGDSEQTSELNVSSVKKAKKESKKEKKSSVKEVKNSKLLSFDEEEEDEEDT